MLPPGLFAQHLASVSSLIVERLPSDASGVRKRIRAARENPNPVSPVARADVSRSQHLPFRIIPERGKITEDSGKTSSNKHRTVFHERESRSNIADNSRKLAPQSATRAVDARAFSRHGDVLTGEAAADDVDAAAPRAPVERAHVFKDGERREEAVALPRHKDSAAERFDFDGAYGAPSQERSGENAASSPGKKGEFPERRFMRHPP